MTVGDGKFFNFRPVTFCAIFLALGGVFGLLVTTRAISPWWMLSLLPLAFLIAFLSLKWLPSLLATLVLCLCVGVGYTTFCDTVASFAQTNAYDGEYVVTGIVTEKEKSTDYFIVAIEELTIDGNPEKGRLIAYLPTRFWEEVRLADEIVAKGYVKSTTDLTNGYGFRAQEIAEGESFRLSQVSSLQRTGQAFRPFLLVRQRLIDVLDSGMTDESAAFCLGLLTGNDSLIEKGLLQNIRYGGIAHLFAVSGLHIGVLFGLCAYLTSKTFFLKRGKLFCFFFTALVLVFYGGVCGFSASVIRAIVTCLSAYAYKLIGSKRDAIECVSFAAIVVLLLFPTTLFSVGFLLSFASCYGILLLSKPIKELLDKAIIRVTEFWKYTVRKKEKVAVKRDIFQGDTSPKSIGERGREKTTSFLSVTLAAWLATTPICLSFFDYFSVWGILLNCIFVPVISLFFIVLFALASIVCLFPFAAPVVLYLPSVCISPVLLFFELFSFGGVKLEITVPAVTLYYLALLFCTDKLRLTKQKSGGCFC